ncbi:MAG: nitrilase-related carbon-nitrogen hydrolase [Candidatus Eisenbacteria bacterium]|nr:nitrilase-related carbon-nitrogen hydrolase [Candidatus Eisenbacteria bacterium]
MKVAFVQTKPVFGEKARNLESAAKLIEKTDCDLFVLPELFATGYSFSSKEEVRCLSEKIPQGETTAFLSKLAKDKVAYIVFGIAEKAGPAFYNSAVLLSPRGFVGCYRKVHLFLNEKKLFRPGNTGFQVFNIGLARLGIIICFDWLFPESMRTLALKGADVVCHPANLVLPFCQTAMLTRCLENRVFAVTANRTGTEKRAGKTLTFTGGSQMVDPSGTPLIKAGTKREEVGIFEIDPTDSRDKWFTPGNHVLKDRRPEFYAR